MQDFWAGFEKQAGYITTVPLKSDKAKQEYSDRRTSSTRTRGALVGGLAGGLAGSLHPRSPGKGALIGAAAGAGGMGLLGHVLGRRIGKRHGEVGIGEAYSHDLPGVVEVRKKYNELNKEK